MTISSTTNRVSFAGNGVTVAFATSPVVFFDSADLAVYEVITATGASTLKTLTTDYTVTGGSGTTGTVTMIVAPATGTTLLIVRDVAITQGSDLVNNDASDAEVIEDAFDRLTMITQQLDARIDRSFRLADSDVTGVDVELPDADTRALSVMGFDVNGDFTLYDPVSAVTESANVSFTGTATGEVATNVSAYLNLKVKGLRKNFACAADGVDTGDSAKITSAFASGKIIEAEDGTYLTGSQILPSNFELIGWGTNRTIFKAKNSLNAQVFKNSDTSSGNVNISLRDFKIIGNSANQASGDRSGIVFQKVTYGLIQNVYINDMTDWSFGMYQGDYLTLKDCVATGMVGINDANGVRAGYLFGTTSTLRLANNVTVENCVASTVTTPYVDGFILEQGTGITIRGCTAKSVPYSGFKLNAMHNVSFIDNTADSCLVGFQKLGYNNNVSYMGNLAYKNSGAGFYLGNSDTGNISKGLIVHGNRAIDNGQNAYSALYGASGSRYGIAFEGTTSATVDRVSVKDNICLDNGGGTQGRGLSFGTNGTFSNVFIGGNVCKGNTADFINAGSLQLATLTYGSHIGFDSGSTYLAGGQSRHRYSFYLTDAAAGASATQLSDGMTGVTPRGHIMPRAGYLLGIYVKSNAAVTAGSITFFPRINNSNFGSGLAITSGTFNTTEELFQANAFAAGDILTCVYTSTGGLLPAGTDDFDVTILVVY